MLRPPAAPEIVVTRVNRISPEIDLLPPKRASTPPVTTSTTSIA